MLIFIGDKRQQIYTWRGATNALELMQKYTNAKALPMNLSQRCSKAVVNIANTIFPNDQIQALENAPMGSVTEMELPELFKKVQKSDFILCRTNLPLIRCFYHLIKNKIKAFVLGRDMGYNLISLLDSTMKDCKTDDIALLAQALTENCKTSVDVFLKSNKTMEAASIEDRTQSLLVFFEGSQNVQQIKDKIKETFSDDGEGVCLSTVHKIKGAEAPNVYILRPDLMPHPKSQNALEENCIKFVAFTRAKVNLILVNGDFAKPIRDTADDESETIEIESKQE